MGVLEVPFENKSQRLEIEVLGSWIDRRVEFGEEKSKPRDKFYTV